VPQNAGEALQAARGRLAATSKHPRRDAELLLEHVLGCDATALLTHPERILSTPESEQFDRLVERRLASEPMQYLTVEQEFFGLRFEVSPAVLIPRPETEHLVEAVLERFEREEAVHIVDVGTGSGAIAVALAHALPFAEITATDVSAAALVVAKSNAARNGFADRIRFFEGDLLEPVAGERFDIAVSNPPYVPESDRDTLNVEVRDYEPSQALFAGEDGLAIYRRLIPAAFGALVPGGFVALEIGYRQQKGVQALLAEAGFSGIESTNDLQKIPRVVVARRP
jgi:release factor glutamine methyltransferase